MLSTARPVGSPPPTSSRMRHGQVKGNDVAHSQLPQRALKYCGASSAELEAYADLYERKMTNSSQICERNIWARNGAVSERSRSASGIDLIQIRPPSVGRWANLPSDAIWLAKCCCRFKRVKARHSVRTTALLFGYTLFNEEIKWKTTDVKIRIVLVFFLS